MFRIDPLNGIRDSDTYTPVKVIGASRTTGESENSLSSNP